MKRTIATTSLALWAALAWSDPVPVTVNVQVDRPGKTVSPMLFGVFFEDINYAADGGLYAELVQNRSFEHGDSFAAWGLVNRGAAGTAEVATERPLNENNPRYVRLSIKDAGSGFGLANYGFAGIPVRKDDKYLLSLWARSTSSVPLQLTIENESGRVLAEAKVDVPNADWKKIDLALVPNETSTDARLVVAALDEGQLDLDMVSLFPEKTFKRRRNGLRQDIAEKVAALKPAFIRFPGGCIVEGEHLEDRYQWKHSIGKIE